MLTMTNDNDIASKPKVTICILFIFGQIIVLTIRIRLNSKEPYSVEPKTTTQYKTKSDYS